MLLHLLMLKIRQIPLLKMDNMKNDIALHRICNIIFSLSFLSFLYIKSYKTREGKKKMKKLHYYAMFCNIILCIICIYIYTFSYIFIYMDAVNSRGKTLSF